MSRNPARVLSVAILCFAVAGCKVHITAPDFGFGDLCTNECETVSLKGASRLLLGDTAVLSASTGGGYTDIQWETSTPSLSFLRSAVRVQGFLWSASSQITVRGDALGSSVVTARRGVSSASVEIAVVPVSAVKSIAVRRLQCPFLALTFCNAESSKDFGDTIHPGDSVVVTVDIADAEGRSVTATPTFTSSNAGVATTGIKAGFYEPWIWFVSGVGTGDAVITAKVAGLTASFTLHVAK